MGRALITPFSGVQLHGTEGVDGEPLVGVDSDTEETGVGVDELVDITDLGVPENTGISKEGQVSHVISTVELSGVDLADKVLLEHLHLSLNIDGPLGSILGLKETLQVATIGLVGDPHGLLGVIGLGLVLFLEGLVDN